jgi:glycosyltransferase involved in cell wall biosynthesis
VVAADVAGLRDSVRDGETGLLVPHGNSEAFAGALNSLFQDAELRNRMGAAGRQWAGLHSWDVSAGDLRTSLVGLLTASRRAAIDLSLPLSIPSNGGAEEV